MNTALGMEWICPMPDLFARGPLGQKAGKAKRDPARLAAVAKLACVICGSRPVQVHHVICGRYSQRKAPDSMTIPLCHFHHLGAGGIHQDKAAWQAAHGPDYGFLPLVDYLISQSDP
jgi:hypothetical protein